MGLDVSGYGKVAEIAKGLGFKALPQDPEKFVKETMVLPLVDEPSSIRVDLILSFIHYERQAIDRARQVDISGMKVSFAQPEDVVIHKIFVGRPRDLEDARIILVKNPDIDGEYIRRWPAGFDEAMYDKDFWKVFIELKES